MRAAGPIDIMAQQSSSTQVVASHRVAKPLKPYTQPDHSPSQEPELREVLVYSLREHMTLEGHPNNERFNDAEVFDCSKAMVVKGGAGKFHKLESGLLGAIEMAYAGGHCLHLRPDDIWLAIAQGVSAHLSHEKNAEKYRNVFVDHQGKEDIVVDCTDFLTGE
ncbi:hypothetical protein KFL_002030115 [Klebsormidium nitens]|uniref:Uncharacterized protein n=1 Tax=Klebsormidium nitens TaxID=105231 RepID=A0A1Y1I5Q1_KLENI|nr:hypothetical protein KFL_002030115 [Klebsormidium nitens]|eukprot:GAQ84729.1 hypothetical protein KFL_002030115 [Klebsormidium nitens]